MNKLITIAAVGLTACGLGLGRAAAENPCAHGYICTPCGPVGQYNAFSPVYKKGCCPCCGQPHAGKHCHLTQYNAFSPLVEDCSKKGWFHWLHHGCKSEPAECCPPSGCDWGYQGDLPDCGTSCTPSAMNVFPQGVIQGQPAGEGAKPMPSPAPATKPSPTSPEPLKAPVQK